MKIIIILLIVMSLMCFWGASLISVSNSKKRIAKPKIAKPKIKMLNRDGDVHEDEWHTYIAGLKYHISKYDIGGFTGYVVNDPTNSHDSKAMAICSGIKLLGYIPAKELTDYRKWCEAKPQPCVGFVYVEDGQYRGRVKILRPCNEEFLQTELSRYLQWVRDNYGSEYLPKTMSMQFDIE